MRRRTSRGTVYACRIAGVALSIALAAATFVPALASANIYLPPDPFFYSSTNPGAPNDYDVTWREGWGNDPLAAFTVVVPQPDVGQPAIVGAYYFVQRPSAIATATINSTVWPQCYNAVLVGKSAWDLYVDLPAEWGSPGPLFAGTGWVPPSGVTLGRPYEGPYTIQVQFFASGVLSAARGLTTVGLDMTPPLKVTGIKATPGYGASLVNGWLTQSRVHLDWDDKVYDGLSGTGYFEIYMDGKPYPATGNSTGSRRVYDLKEHYPLYGIPIDTRRGLTIEDLPAGEHVFQIRAVDRATNPGPLSDPVTIKVDPDIPTVSITAPEVDGQRLGVYPTFAADVEDKGGVASVQFFVDGVLKATDITSPYSATVDVSAFANGSTHTLRVVATDVVGRTNFAENTFVVDKTPKATILSPSRLGVTLTSPALLSASVEDATGISSVVFTVDGSVVETYAPPVAGTTAAVVMSLTPLTAGVHTLVVSVTGTAGGQVSASQQFAVDPSLSISPLQLLLPGSEGQMTGSSSTNPYAPGDANTGWREMWGSSLYPNFTISSPSFNATQQAEMFYMVDRMPAGSINPANPASYYRSVHPQGTEILNEIDQLGVLASNPSLDGLTLYPGRASESVEGIWFWHVLFQDAQGRNLGSYSTPYGIDRTPPSAVSGLGAYSSSTAQQPTTGWFSQNRVVLKWSNVQQDKLSGTAYYRVYLDGSCVIPGSSSPLDPASGAGGMPWYRTGRSQESLTLESVGAGKHTVQITAVDRAGNEGARGAGISVFADFDAPGLAIVKPASSASRLSAASYLSVQASDTGGVASVNYAIDGVSVGTMKPTKYATTFNSNLRPEWSGYANGLHRFTAKVTDMVGRQTSVSRDFILDKKAPSVSIKSSGPSPFYPRIREGYKDNYSIKFSSSEEATASMLIYNTSGTLRRTISKRVAAGTSTLTWDGTLSSLDFAKANLAKTYKYKVKIRLVDRAGNTTTSSSRSASIMFYEIVKTGPNSAKIVDR